MHIEYIKETWEDKKNFRHQQWRLEEFNSMSKKEGDEEKAKFLAREAVHFFEIMASQIEIVNLISTLNMDKKTASIVKQVKDIEEEKRLGIRTYKRITSKQLKCLAFFLIQEHQTPENFIDYMINNDCKEISKNII